MTSSGISLPCLHGPFCEGCLSVWSRVNRTCPACRKKTGYDDNDCWVHLEEPDLNEIVEGLYAFIRRLKVICFFTHRRTNTTFTLRLL
eukprot:28921_1